MLGNVTSKFSNWLGLDYGVLENPLESDQDGFNTNHQREQSNEPMNHTYPEKSPQDATQEDKGNYSSDMQGGGEVSASEPEIQEKNKESTIQPNIYVSTKAYEGAKFIGGFLSSAVNKAGKTVSEASARIKKTVEENSILADFNKEQESFIKEKQAKVVEAAFPPWTGCANEESVKEKCLNISKDRRNFVRSPPTGVDFNFDYEVSYPVAVATLSEDPNLEKMRFELVPKVINEENFWRNYFYRVSLIRQASELSSIVQEQNHSASKTSSVNVVCNSKPHSTEVPVLEQVSTESPSDEFLADTFEASSTYPDETQHEMKKLCVDSEKTEEEWEKELEAELQDYEVVVDREKQQDSNWENQIEEMLNVDDTTDFK